ncbi:hypothetical protein M8J77_006279 [Diaphorina citri]|nr:hypothetical protein M8J77_006279 [Diaphorina citri]
MSICHKFSYGLFFACEYVLNVSQETEKNETTISNHNTVVFKLLRFLANLSSAVVSVVNSGSRGDYALLKVTRLRFQFETGLIQNQRASNSGPSACQASALCYGGCT